MQEEIPVIILCGGKGTRMGDRTIPKPLVEVGDRPILWHVMKIFAAQGFSNFILALGYGGDSIKRYFTEYNWLNRDFTLQPSSEQPHGQPTYHTPIDISDWRVTLTDTGLETRKGSRVRRAAHYVNASRFFVTYADGVGDVDLHALVRYHKSHHLLATITGVRAYSRFGILETDGKGRITGYQEKPLMDALINGGFMLFERGVLDYLQGGDDIILEAEPFERLAADRQLAVYHHEGFWRSMDTFKEAQELNVLWEEGAPWKVW